MKNERKYSKCTINDILHLTTGSWIQLILNYSPLIPRNFQYILSSHLRGRKCLETYFLLVGLCLRDIQSPILIQYLISISITLLILITQNYQSCTPRSLISTRDKKEWLKCVRWINLWMTYTEPYPQFLLKAQNYTEVSVVILYNLVWQDRKPDDVVLV